MIRLGIRFPARLFLFIRQVNVRPHPLLSLPLFLSTWKTRSNIPTRQLNRTLANRTLFETCSGRPRRRLLLRLALLLPARLRRSIGVADGAADGTGGAMVSPVNRLNLPVES